MRLKLILAAVLLITALPGIAHPVHAQTLGDLARKEEERRKKEGSDSKVYTNKDLAPVPTASSPPPPSEPAKSAAAGSGGDKDAKADTQKEQEPAKDQAYWAGRKKELQTQLERDQSYAEALQTRMNSLNTDFTSRDDPAQRAVIARDRQKATGELERLQKAIQDGKKAIGDLEEEARRAGVPPGWLR